MNKNTNNDIDKHNRHKHYAIHNVLKHRGDMLFLERIVDIGDDWIECAVKLEAGDIMASGHVPAWFGIEYMGQAAAALEGVLALNRGNSIGTSFIIGAKRVQSSVPYFSADKRLFAKATMQFRDDTGVGVYACTICSDQEELMSALIKGVMPKDDTEIYRRVI